MPSSCLMRGLGSNMAWEEVVVRGPRTEDAGVWDGRPASERENEHDLPRLTVSSEVRDLVYG